MRKVGVSVIIVPLSNLTTCVLDMVSHISR